MTQSKRMKLGARLLVILSGMAALSTGLALVLQDRALSGDLEEAARGRLDRAAAATEILLSNHLDALHERYRAVSGTPQFRATLELGDGPTLQYYARGLVSREGAELIAFFDSAGVEIAAAGGSAVSARLGSPSESTLLADAQGGLAVTVVPLLTHDEVVGRLLAVEVLGEGLLAQWSDLCGAEVALVAAAFESEGRVERVVRQMGDFELRVALSLGAERQALLHSRLSLLSAGGIALAVALCLGVFASRGVVGPIDELRKATERAGDGDFDAELSSRRGDEIGDMTRAFDRMLGRLRAYRSQVESDQVMLEEHVAQLRESEKQLADAQKLAHIGSWELDLGTGQLRGSEEFRRLLSLPLDDKPIPAREAGEALLPEDRENLEEAIRICARERSMLRVDCRIKNQESGERIVHLQAEVHLDDDGGPAGLAGTMQDVTERKRSEEQIRYLAYHDSLTGLGNRLLCKERLALEITQARRANQMLGVLFLDLDRFKRINDTLGHSLGDELLQGVADRLVSSVRETDWISRRRMSSAISRIGGDEFTVIAGGLRDAQDLAKIARRILQGLSRPFQLAGHEMVISGSIGISAFPHDGDDVESLLRNADAAMYHAKEQGRNNYQFYAESMNEVALRRLLLENKLRHGLDREEFELHYQPKIDLETGAITSSEALIRWREPETGLVSPAIFIPLAEETGLIGPIGEWVLREACRQIAAWRSQGIELPVSVNLSTHQFRTGSLARHVLGIMAEHGTPSELLELEITESTLMHDTEAVVADLLELRSAGVRISVDDFGTGYSSFSYLKQLPVDALKIDRSFIIGIADDASAAALAASIISMGHALGLKVIAEGVEDEAQRALLAEWRCDEMQGFLVSPAVPPEDFAELIGC